MKEEVRVIITICDDEGNIGEFEIVDCHVNEKGEYYVIDWAHATQGNASADCARTFLLFCVIVTGTASYLSSISMLSGSIILILYLLSSVVEKYLTL